MNAMVIERAVAEAILREKSEYELWCEANSCTHAHCPCHCEHPQPFLLKDGRLVCGECAIVDGFICNMVPCTPANCHDG